MTARSNPPLGKWTVPGTGLALGVLIGLAVAAGGHPWWGLWCFGVMVVYSAVLLLFRRSGTVRILSDQPDERYRALAARAERIAGLVLVVALIAGFIVEVARGHSGAPYTWLGFLYGVTFVTSAAVLNRRG
jgi:uncharacterized membrane protein YfcA